MRFVLELYRHKKIISGSAALLMLLLGASPAFGSSTAIVYKTSLTRDLDGDHIPETATVKQHGSIYLVSIHFSTGRPKLRLQTFVTPDLAGLAFELADLNNDSEADFIVTSATSNWPVAIWMNHGGAHFQRIKARSYGPVRVHRGFRLRVKREQRHDPTGTLSTNPAPQLELAASFGPGSDSHRFFFAPSDPSPSELTLTHIPPRGPPSPSHI